MWKTCWYIKLYKYITVKITIKTIKIRKVIINQKFLCTFAFGWNFKWLKKLTGKIAISVVYDIQPADMKVWWTTSLLSIITTLQKDPN